MAKADNNGTTMVIAPVNIELTSEAQTLLDNFWPKVNEDIKKLTANDFKQQELPLARIKKIMKLDEDVKMISAEAPVLFSKAAEIFISELSLRSWVHTEENKRRTLQKNDVGQAVAKYDQFDFLIDIVPRDEVKVTPKREDNTQQASMTPSHVQYYFQLAQQAQQQQQQAAQQQTQQAAVQQQTPQAVQIQAPGGQIIQQPGGLQLQVSGNQIVQIPQLGQQAATVDSTNQLQPQVIQIQQPQQQQAQQQQQQQAQQQTQQQQQTAQQAASGATTQVFQQIRTPSGEVQNVPVQLTQTQLNQIILQMQGKQPGQPIVIQTANMSDEEGEGELSQQYQVQMQQVNYIQGESDQSQDTGDV